MPDYNFIPDRADRVFRSDIQGSKNGRRNTDKVKKNSPVSSGALSQNKSSRQSRHSFLHPIIPED